MILVIGVLAVLAITLAVIWPCSPSQRSEVPFIRTPQSKGEPERMASDSSAERLPVVAFRGNVDTDDGSEWNAQPREGPPWWELPTQLQAWRSLYGEWLPRVEDAYYRGTGVPRDMQRDLMDSLWLSLADFDDPQLVGLVNSGLEPGDYVNLVPMEANSLDHILADQRKSMAEWRGVPPTAGLFPAARMRDHPFEFAPEFHLEALGASPDWKEDPGLVEELQRYQRRELGRRASLIARLRMYETAAMSSASKLHAAGPPPPFKDLPGLLGDPGYRHTVEALARQDKEYLTGLRRLLEESGHVRQDPGGEDGQAGSRPVR